MKYFHTLGSSSRSFIAIFLPINSLSGSPNEDPVCLKPPVKKIVSAWLQFKDIFFHFGVFKWCMMMFSITGGPWNCIEVIIFFVVSCVSTLNCCWGGVNVKVVPNVRMSIWKLSCVFIQSDTQTHTSNCGGMETAFSWALSAASSVRGTNLSKSKSIEENRDCRMAQRPQKKLDAWWKREKILKDHDFHHF